VKLLLDSNIVSYLLREVEPVGSHYSRAAADGAVFLLSPIVDYEIRRYLTLKSASRSLARYEALTRSWLPVTLDMADWHHAADLWAERHRQGQAIADADLLIAVSVLKAGAVLVSNNGRHFGGFGFEVRNWMQPG
jgi:predicted nucleic acid-binding protein